jgi:NADH-quinone oxidoreductase subunit L
MELLFFTQLLILIAGAGFGISLLLPAKNESLISRTAFLTVGAHLVVLMVFLVTWIWHGAPILSKKDLVLFHTPDYEFFIDLYFDKITATYLLVGSILTFLVTLYSRNYLHRESGYKRFFSTVLFFFTGYNITVTAGNLETLFIGWEMLGISSFLLIAFYRDRYLPVKNAVKVFSIYRVADVGLILAMWASHHLWLENITFEKLNNYQLVDAQLMSHSWIGVFISAMFLLSALAKSAQFPLSTWLPRAMEGPTPSTAIFYGSLSVHLGVFLMLRTFPFWEHQWSVRICIGLLGLVSALVATGIARVQSSVKSQIAYSSIAQIGLIFVEIALGWKDMALVHFAGNAFLRTYQLLVSPSVVSYLIREQFYHFKPREHSLEDSLPKRLEYSLYILSLKEWNLDTLMYRYLWNPLKSLGRRLDFISTRPAIAVFVFIYLGGATLLFFESSLPHKVHHALPFVFSLIGIVFVLKAFTERKNVILSWLLVVLNHFWIALAVLYNEHLSVEEVVWYLSGVTVAGAVGYVVLIKLRKKEHYIDLDRFHGYSWEHTTLSFVFLLACLGVSGFPITPTFIGEDLLFSHIHEDQYALAFFAAMSFILDGLAIIRIYARIFLGPHVKSQFEMAYRST